MSLTAGTPFDHNSKPPDDINDIQIWFPQLSHTFSYTLQVALGQLVGTNCLQKFIHHHLAHGLKNPK